MYQVDIGGMNAIDYAFNRNAIFSIKAFVETLLILTDSKFRNCFDKAILMMINRGMEIKDLVNSELFYASIWTEMSLFSPNENVQLLAYSGEVDELEFEDPNMLFNILQKKNYEQSFDK